MPETADLAATFLAHVKRSLAPPVDTTALQRVLVQAWERARALWQSVDLSPELFVRHLAERLPKDEAGGPVESLLEQMRPDELYLACACLHQVPLAAETFEQHYLRKLPGLIQHRERSAAALDEICQQTRVKILVATAKGPPSIADYKGTGPLMAWVRMIAVRVAAREHEKQKRYGSSDSDEVDLDPGEIVNDPQVQFLKDRYREDLRRAMRESFDSLSDEERYHLRLHYLDKLSGYKMAGLLGTSQPTVSRRLDSIRNKVRSRALRQLQERLGLKPEEAVSFMKLVDSQLNLRISQLLGNLPAPD